MDNSLDWSEVDAIIASIDPNRASWISLLGYDAPNTDTGGFLCLGNLLVSPEDWATLYKIESALPALRRHGFDSLNFMNGTLTQSDCDNLQLKSEQIKNRLMKAVEDLPCILLTIPSQNISTIADFLEFLNLNSYIEKFSQQGFSLIDDIKDITDANLAMDLQVCELGHRRRILQALHHLFNNTICIETDKTPQDCEIVGKKTFQSTSHHCLLPHKNQTLSNTDKDSNYVSSWSSHSTNGSLGQLSHQKQLSSVDTSCRRTNLSENSHQSIIPFSISDHQSDTSSENQIIHRKTRSATDSNMHSITPQATNSTKNVRRETFCVSAPMASKYTKLPSSKQYKCQTKEIKKQKLKNKIEKFSPLIQSHWPHHPDVLLKNDFSYLVSYLGFRPLVDYENQSEVLDVIQMFRCKGINIIKLPTIRLIFRYNSIQFCNPDNESIITEHLITDIYCVNQDNTRRANFAYVTNDRQTSTHYCHCFTSNSPETATLIIQTLAQACQLADQIIEFNNKM